MNSASFSKASSKKCARLAALVDALSVLAKADAGVPVIAREPLRLDEMLREAVEHTRLLASKAGLTIELTRCDEALYDGDRPRLRQVLLNLFDNAVKHNVSGGWVSAELRAEPGHFTLMIENARLSIPAELLPQIFDRFRRGPVGNEGSSLGLSIAGTIVEAHGVPLPAAHASAMIGRESSRDHPVAPRSSFAT